MPDVLRVLGAQLIAWHHLSAYGPLPQALQAGLSDLMAFLFHQARYAVQLFMVLGGYLAMRGLHGALVGTAPHGAQAGPSAWRLIGQRYMRLIQVYWPVLLLTLLVSAATRETLDPDLVPPSPDAWHVLGHLLLLQGVLGQDSLTAGVWYVAMDLQLYALLVAMVLALGRLAPAWRLRACCALLGLGVVASLLVFNRQPALDNWAPYFFCAYGLGALAALAPRSRLARGLLLGLLALACAAAWLEPRPRVLLAVLCTVLLRVGDRWRVSLPARQSAWRLLFRLSDASYAFFLLNFSLVLLANTVWTQAGWQGFAPALAWVLLTWALNVLLADWVHRRLEKPMRLAHALHGVSRQWGRWCASARR